MSQPRKAYSDDEKAAALASYRLHGGSARKAARETGIKASTITNWARDANLVAQGMNFAYSHDEASPAEIAESDDAPDLVRLWARTELMANERMQQGLADPDARLSDVARAAQVAHENHLNHRDGRKGVGEIHLDQRKQQM